MYAGHLILYIYIYILPLWVEHSCEESAGYPIS